MKSILLILAATALFNSTVAQAEVAVIVNKANASAITTSDASRIFLGKIKSFANGNKIVPVNLPASSPARSEFEQKALKKSASQLKAFWSKQIFTGKGKPPKDLGSETDVINFVANNANGIGYVDAAQVTDSVKVIATF
ncbi:MAG: phosphate ABC transporter substrate-binding protein [Gammaproteobacteria bacterium]|nr:phosphate ABC transporter substrate-binding protein [Gammaproteobacteria bacterium]